MSAAVLNLAAVRYRHVLASAGGPVERVDCGETSVAGRRCFLANAYLRPELRGAGRRGGVWGEADGSGTAASPLVARHKAVSEALERWALFATVRGGGRERCGFDVDASSNGMAAFPGWWARQARPAAWAEAVERFCLLHWWEGKMRAVERPSPWPGVEAVVLAPATWPALTVILHRESEPGLHAFGHAAARDFAVACGHAMAELERHEAVVRHRALARAGEAARVDEAGWHAIDRRAVFFSTDEGHGLFRERVRASRAVAEARPRPVFDGAVRGPWERYAHVWRVVFAPPSDRFISDDPRYFLW